MHNTAQSMSGLSGSQKCLSSKRTIRNIGLSISIYCRLLKYAHSRRQSWEFWVLGDLGRILLGMLHLMLSEVLL